MNGSDRRFKIRTVDVWFCLCLCIGAGGFGVDTSILASWLAYARDTTDLLLTGCLRAVALVVEVNL